MPIRLRSALIAFALFLPLAISACQPEEDATPPRPTVIVITSQGPYFEPFDTASDWLVGESERSQGVVADGQYRLSITTPGYFVWSHQQRAFGDAIYEVDASLISGPEASAFGLLLLGSSDVRSFFYCMITGDGRYDVGYCKDGCRTQESLVGGLTLAYTILTSGQANHLRVELASGELTFYINGAPVSQIRDLAYEPGLVGLIGESSPYGGFEAAFDNLQVIEPTQP
jgi:hypothetical protein